MNDQDIEQEIQAKGLTAPRVTPADIEANIVDEYFFTAEQGVHAAYATGDGAVPTVPALSLHTFCVLVLRNGFTVTGESACASPENFDAELGRKVARQNAISKVLPLMGYALRERLAAGEQAAVTENLLSRAMGWIEILEQILDADPDSVVLEARNSKTGEEAEFKLSDFKGEVAAVIGVVAEVEEVGDEEGAR